MIKHLFTLVLVLLLIAGCTSNDKGKFTDEQMTRIPLAQREGFPQASGGFVLAVGDQTLTSDEVVTAQLLERFRPIAQGSDFQQFKKQAKPALQRIVTSRISDILLYQLAERQAGEDIDKSLEKAVQAEVRRFVVSFGGDYAKAEQALKEMGMDWQSFNEYQKKTILSQSYMASQLPPSRPITYSELVDRYNQMKEKFFAKPAIIEFRLIDIQIAKLVPSAVEGLEVTDPNQDRQQQAKLLADELVKQINEGKDFGELALAYSHGYRQQFSGLWKPVKPESLAKPYDVLALEAEKIEPGQIAGPIEADGHIFIMKLEQKQAKSFVPLEKVQSKVEARINLERRREAINELEEKLAQQVAFSEKDAFIDFCLEEIYRICNQ
jgi:hypothetical protein